MCTIARWVGVDVKGSGMGVCGDDERDRFGMSRVDIEGGA